MNMHDKTVSKGSSTPESSEPVTKRPPQRVLWFIIVGVSLAVFVVLIVLFNGFITNLFKGIFANIANNPPPANVSVSIAKTEVMPRQLAAVGELAAVHQVDVTADVTGRVTDIHFQPGAAVKKGDPLVQLFDAPEKSDLASFKAQQAQAALVLSRARELVAKQAGTQATVDQAQSAFDQASAAVQKTETIISQKLVKAPWDGDLGMRKVEVGQFVTSGTQIVSLTDLTKVYVNFTATEKDSAILRVGQTVRIAVDAYPGRKFEGKITTIEPQISLDTRNIRVQATLDNPEGVLKPGMFATTTVILPPNPAVVTLPETAIDYTLYGDSVYLVVPRKNDDGTPKTNPDGSPQFSAERTFVRTGQRNDGRVTVVSGVKEGDRVVAVGQNKLQPGATVTVSDNPPPPVPATPARN